MEGVKIGPRAQEVARAYKDTLDYRGLFYDGHACFATLLADDRETHGKLLESVHDYLESQRTGWNKDVTQRVGLPLMEGITQYFDGDYGKSVATLAPIMGELQTKIQGSRAQKDVFRQILLSAAIKSGAKADLAQAKQVRLFEGRHVELLTGWLNTRCWQRSWRKAGLRVTRKSTRG